MYFTISLVLLIKNSFLNIYAKANWFKYVLDLNQSFLLQHLIDFCLRIVSWYLSLIVHTAHDTIFDCWLTSVTHTHCPGTSLCICWLLCMGNSNPDHLLRMYKTGLCGENWATSDKESNKESQTQVLMLLLLWVFGEKFKCIIVLLKSLFCIKEIYNVC